MNPIIFVRLSDWTLIAFMIFTLIFMLYFGYSIYSCHQKNFIKRKKITLALLGATCLTLFSFKYLFENRIFEETIISLRDSSTKVFVNDASVGINEQLAVAFEGRTSLKMSGSRPEKKISVKITSANFSLSFLLRQDSRDKNVYWVYIPESIFRRDFSFIKISL